MIPSACNLVLTALVTAVVSSGPTHVCALSPGAQDPVDPRASALGYLESFELGVAALKAGLLAHASGWFERCLELRPGSAVCAFYLACSTARDADARASLDWLERAAASGYDDVGVLVAEADLAALHGQRRFNEVIARVTANRGARTAGGKEASIEWVVPSRIVDYSPDGTRALSSNGLVVDVGTGDVLAQLGRVRGQSPRFGPDARLIVADGRFRDDFRIFDGSTYAELRVVEDSAGQSARVALAPDGSRLIHASRGQPVRVYSIDRGRWVAQLDVPGHELLLFGPQSRYALVAGNARGRSMFPYETRSESLASLVDLTTRRTVADWYTRKPHRYSGAFRHDGRFAVALRWGTAPGGECVVFDVSSGEKRELPGGGDPDYRVAAFAPNADVLVTGAGDGHLEWWSLPALWSSPAPEVAGRTVPAHDDGVDVLRVSPDGEHVVSLAGDDWIRCHTFANGELAWERSEPGATHLSLGDRGETVTIRFDESRRVVRTRDGEDVDEVRCNVAEPRPRLAGRPAVRDGGDVALVPCSDGSVRHVELATGAQVRSVHAGTSALERVELCPNGKLATTGGDGVQLVDERTGARTVLLAREPGRRTAFGSALRPDGEVLLAWSSDGRAGLWSVSTGELIARIEDGNVIRAAAWAPDASVLVTAETPQPLHHPTPGYVVVRGGGNGRALGPCIEHPAPVRDVAFSPDGEQLVTACDDGGARLFRLDGRALQLLTHDLFDGLRQRLPHDDLFGPEPVRKAWFHPGGDRLTTVAGNSGHLWHWNTATADVVWRVTRYSEPWNSSALMSRDGALIYYSSGERGSDVIRVSGGAHLASTTELPVLSLVADDGDGRLLATGLGTVRVLNSIDLTMRFTWIPFSGTSSLTFTPTLHFRGSADAARRCGIQVGDETYPLDCFAALLYDPKKVAAAAAGRSVLPTRLPRPPVLQLHEPKDRLVATENELILKADALDPAGVIGFEVERAGRLVDSGLVESATWRDPSGLRASLALKLDLAGEGTTLRVRAVSATGVLSRPRLVTVKP